ncbi:hypothetical protein D9758_003319 [Tetrapyrgos nigripes]|uniref:Amino acid permease/ SLC12A domain-containing protein n=1 Tax=Tetrapyrgos nigripes TaxID=182062 RepID=A0A8H5GJ50_9AGAR|nr:hypothetical protein D9758_003319 [Tetrapyrgos nigripes]
MDLEKKDFQDSGSITDPNPAYVNPEYEEPSKEESLHRGLKARQISMIALGGAVGTGLIIGSGTALQRGGPLGLLLGYAFVGFVCYLVMVALGEMAAYLPHKKGFAGYATRFVDPAFGFALGWNYLMKYAINRHSKQCSLTLLASSSSIVSISMNHKYPKTCELIAVSRESKCAYRCLDGHIHRVHLCRESSRCPSIWRAGILVFQYQRYPLQSFRLGGNPQHDRIGFRYWQHPDGPMGHYLKSQVHGESLSIFLGFWATLTNALFAFIGTELIGVTVGEAENPRRNIPRAIRQTFYRILVFYIGGVFVIGLIVPSTNENLFVATKSKTGAAASPFVVATQLVGIRVLNHIINAAILLFVMSAANSDLYIGSRTLYGLAIEGKAPKIFRRVNRLGVPYASLILCTLFCGLVFLNVSSSSAKVFTYFVNLVSAFGAITWMCIAYSHLAFMKALKAQGISRDSLPFKAPFQPWGSWFALIATGIITLFKGFDTFLPFKTDTFVTSYIAIPIFIVLWVGYKLWYRTKVIPSESIDLVTGLREIEEDEEKYKLEMKAMGPKGKWGRLIDKFI